MYITGKPANICIESILRKSNKYPVKIRTCQNLAGFLMPCIDPQNQTEGQEGAKKSILATYVQYLIQIFKTFMYCEVLKVQNRVES
jgi:hypothetical protein